MANGRPIHGKNAYIYISGVAMVGANAWTLGITKDAVEATQFLDTWKRKVWGQLDGTGNITAWQHQDRRDIMDAVLADGPVLTYIYHDQDDATNFIYGDLIWTSFSGDGSTTTPVAGSGDFTTSAGTNGLAIMGFA